jgi:hypothetical protein
MNGSQAYNSQSNGPTEYDRGRAKGSCEFEV